MGSDLRCTARYGDRVSEGRALLESDHLLFRGDFRLRIPFAGMASVEARDGWLWIAFATSEGDGHEEVAFELGPQAERWALKIRNPKSRIDKLGVKPQHRVAVLGVEDADFLHELHAQTPHVTIGLPDSCDVLFVRVAGRDGLAGLLTDLEPRIARDGAIWVVSPKGNPAIRDVDVIAAAKEAGLVDTKVVGFSATYTSLKLVVPLARR
jgi:hypothetical protein